MRMNELIQPPVGPNYAYEQTAPDSRRGRFIEPTADLSALYGCPHISIIPSMYIIDPLGEIGVVVVPVCGVEWA
jgi:hypothetical protein